MAGACAAMFLLSLFPSGTVATTIEELVQCSCSCYYCGGSPCYNGYFCNPGQTSGPNTNCDFGGTSCHAMWSGSWGCSYTRCVDVPILPVASTTTTTTTATNTTTTTNTTRTTTTTTKTTNTTTTTNTTITIITTTAMTSTNTTTTTIATTMSMVTMTKTATTTMTRIITTANTATTTSSMVPAPCAKLTELGVALAIVVVGIDARAFNVDIDAAAAFEGAAGQALGVCCANAVARSLMWRQLLADEGVVIDFVAFAEDARRRLADAIETGTFAAALSQRLRDVTVYVEQSLELLDGQATSSTTEKSTVTNTATISDISATTISTAATATTISTAATMSTSTTTTRKSAIANAAVMAMSAGGAHSLFLKNDGTVLATGWNLYGQLADGTMVSKDAPVQVMTDVSVVAAGVYHSLFLSSDDIVFAAGDNRYGQLADGTTVDKATPMQVMTGVRAMSAGWRHSIFLKNDGTVLAAGCNADGQLADGTKIDKATPVQVMTGAIAIAAGMEHSLFLKSDGSVLAAGRNFHGQLADGTNVSKATPVQVMTGVVAISAGGRQSLFLKSDGNVFAVGVNVNGQQGIPVQVMTGVAAMDAGFDHSLFLTNDGTVFAVGQNYNGQLADGTTVRRVIPARVMTGVTALSAGNSHSLFLKKNGTVFAAGWNFYGQLADGSWESKAIPVQAMTGVMPTIIKVMTTTATSTKSTVRNTTAANGISVIQEDSFLLSSATIIPLFLVIVIICSICLNGAICVFCVRQHRKVPGSAKATAAQHDLPATTQGVPDVCLAYNQTTDLEASVPVTSPDVPTVPGCSSVTPVKLDVPTCSSQCGTDEILDASRVFIDL